MDSIASFMGLIKKSGQLDVGEEPVGAVCRARKTTLLVLASDAAANTVRRAKHFAEMGQVPVITLPLTKDQMGMSIGRPPCAMIAINDIGFSSALVKKLAAAGVELEASVDEKLHNKAQRTLQRQREKRAHEKNVARRKKAFGGGSAEANDKRRAEKKEAKKNSK